MTAAEDTDFPDPADRAARNIMKGLVRHQGFRDFWRKLSPIEQVSLMEDWAANIREEFEEFDG